MHNELPFSCPQCGDTGPGGDRCLRCKIELLDRAGRPVLSPPAVFLSFPTFDGFTHPWAAWAAGAAFMICFVYVVNKELPWWALLVVQVALWLTIFAVYFLLKDRRVKQHRTRIQVIRARLSSSSPVAPILQSSGMVRVRGRVSVIKPVAGPMGEPVAAYLVRTQKETVEMVSAGRYGTRRAVTAFTVEESSACGVFLVQDESGVALLDDDAFTVASPALVEADWSQPLSIVIKDGAEVEMLGPAEHKPSSAYPDLALSGSYREAPSLLVFNGTPEQRIILLASPS